MLIKAIMSLVKMTATAMVSVLPWLLGQWQQQMGMFHPVNSLVVAKN
jgi:hypothetical protein